MKTKNEELQVDYFKEGDFVYELYAILVHSGGAHAGHYYAYIKDSADNQWYKFNDVMVHRISFLEIISTFGQKPPTKRRFSSAVQNRANAYMLMYRQVDPTFNVNHVPISFISQELKDEIQADVKVEKEKLQERERKDNQMQLKVIYNDESRTFWVNRREDPLNYLLHLAIKEFELDHIGAENCRLRAYNIVNKVMQETYTGKEEESFDKLAIFPLKTLALETKRSDETFEEYDPNQITLKVNNWQRNIQILDEDNLKPTRMKISKEDTMEDLMNKLSKDFHIPIEHLRVFKRRAIGQGKNVEELSIKKNLSRKLKILRINDGLNLFIENGSYDHPDIEKYSFLSKDSTDNKWETEFELDRNRFTIKFNVPTEDSKEIETNIDYCKQVVLDKRMTVLDLKVAIAKELNIGLEELIFKRGAHGTEVKEDDLSLKAASMYNMICLYIKKGVPSHENEKRLKFILAEFMTDKDRESLGPIASDSLYYNIRELIEIPVNTHQTTYKVKKFLCEKVKEKCELELNPDRIRLREKANERLTKLYRDDAILEQYSMFEGKQIAVQVLDNPDEMDQDSIIISIRCWNPSTWELSPMKEIFIKRYSTLDNFSYIVENEYPFIERKNIECCKVMSSTFFRVQLPYEKWYGLIDNENFLASNPFYLSTDGLLMIVKDRSLLERELTEEEQKEFGCAEYENAIFVTTKGGKRGAMPKEKAIKINVKKKKQSPFDNGFEILTPEDRKEETNGGLEKDVEMKEDNPKSADTNDESPVTTTDASQSSNGFKMHPKSCAINGGHQNGVAKDIDMNDEL